MPLCAFPECSRQIPNRHAVFCADHHLACEPVEARFLIRMKIEADRTQDASREELCSEIGTMLGAGSFSKSMLDAYTSPAKNHDISLVRFKALTRALQAAHLWDIAVCDEGLIILRGDEARLAEIARLEQEKRKIAKQLQTLRSVPVEIEREFDRQIDLEGGAK